MTSALIAFIQERFQLKVTLPLSILLFGAPYSMAAVRWTDFAVGAVATFLSLLCLRIADDLVSVEADMIRHPERGLACGRIASPPLWMGLAAIYGGLLLIHSFFSGNLIGLGLMGLYYALFFSGRPHLPLLIRPLLSNLVFLMIPLYAAGVGRPTAIRVALLMGLFSWAAAVAHEYGHSVHAADEGDPGAASYSSVLGPRGAAILAATAFGLALAFGLAFWQHAGRPGMFLIGLVITALHLGHLCHRLIRRPCAAQARPFYVYGFTFFLLPYLGFVIDNL